MIGRAPRITDIRPLPLRAPLERPVRSALGELRARNGLLVIVETDAGLTGIGESWVNFPSWALAERVATVTEGLRPLLIGELVDDPRRLWRRCVDVLHRIGLQWGALGPIYQAVSGVDLALWDIAGKAEGVPVWKLLGAPHQETVPAYASGLGPDASEVQAAAAREAGFRAVKLKVGFGREIDERNLRAVRNAIDDALLYTDANQGWSLAEAAAMAPLLAAVDAGWIEEPCAVDDDAWDDVPALFAMPVAGGENLLAERQFGEWIAAGRLGVIQPDICKCGGLTAALAILERAGRAGLRLAPHYFGGAVGLAATVHLFAALPPQARERVEYDINPSPLREALLTEPLFVGQGMLRVPDAPGLGIDLNWRTVQLYQL